MLNCCAAMSALLIAPLPLSLQAQVQSSTQTPVQLHGAQPGQQGKPSAIDPDSSAIPAAPAQPQSLLQAAPTQATIEATPGSLKISADNASLTQTLERISEKTGMKVDGVTGDERVFGTFGPGDPRDVLSTLLRGTSYNIIMVGSLENGAPRELLLSQRATGASSPSSIQPATVTPSADDDTPETSSDDAQPMPPPGRPPGPGGERMAHTPQELLQQLRAQQQQQNQNQPQ